MALPHRPVLLYEVIENIDFNEAGSYLDLTFGGGGHTNALLEKAGNRVTAVDRDLSAIEASRASGRFRRDPRLALVHKPFSEVDFQGSDFNGVVLDLGVSTTQILLPERGFSFQEAGPLDMRMDKSRGDTLETLLGEVNEEDLADILHTYGDVPGARKQAARILEKFHQGDLKTTKDLASLFKGRPSKVHPATQAFMALRMAVNEELQEIETTLPRIPLWLKPGGRLAVISFHSVEDRVVKRTLKTLCGECICGKPNILCLCKKPPQMKWVVKRPLEASPEELRANPRSRSAKLRVAEKLG